MSKKHMSGGMSSGKGMTGFVGRSNPNVTPATKAGTPAIGDAKPDANMPANNHGTFPVKLGSGQSSKFGHGVAPASAQKGAIQPSGPRANMAANNTVSKKIPLGTTMHSVGTVPSYLKNPGNSGAN